MSGLINLHRPKELWEAQAKAAKEKPKEVAATQKPAGVESAAENGCDQK